MTTCVICIEKFNKLNRYVIKCHYCFCEICSSCVEKYLFNIYKDPECMSCNKPWNHEFIFNNTTKAFRQRLSKHRENVLIEREKAMLPDTQLYLEYDKEIKNDINEVNELMNRKNKLYSKINSINNKINLKNIKINCWKNDYIIANENDYLSDSSKRQFIKKCPDENCRGYISKQYKCGTCEKRICKHCHIILDENDHECNEDDVKTAEYITKSSKPCPSCAIMIYKIDGCDQMWCTQCKTPFSWNTGKIIKGQIHNPHYFHWLQNRNLTELENNNYECNGGLPDINHYFTHIRIVYRSYNVIDKLSSYYRLLVHINEVEIPKNAINITEDKLNLDLRLKWLYNDVSENDWKNQLRKRERINLIKNEKNRIFEMCVQIMTDVIIMIMRNNDSENDYIKEINESIKYTNECFANAKKTLDILMPNIVFTENNQSRSYFKIYQKY